MKEEGGLLTVIALCTENWINPFKKKKNIGNISHTNQIKKFWNSVLWKKQKVRHENKMKRKGKLIILFDDK